jgi:hypothetical protein
MQTADFKSRSAILTLLPNPGVISTIGVLDVKDFAPANLGLAGPAAALATVTPGGKKPPGRFFAQTKPTSSGRLLEPSQPERQRNVENAEDHGKPAYHPHHRHGAVARPGNQEHAKCNRQRAVKTQQPSVI